MFTLGMFVGGLLMLLPVAAICVWLDRRHDARCRITARVDQTPVPMPGAYERPPERILAGPPPRPVVDGEVLTERDPS